MSSIIEFRNLNKDYPDGTKGLEDINLVIEPGEFIFLIGTSGAGKTTLMKHIVREELPTTGDVIVDGDNVVNLKKRNLPNLRRKVGFIYQDFRLLDSNNVFENVALSLYVVGKPQDHVNAVVTNLLQMVGLGGKENKFPGALSGGEKQRLALARALAHEPKILLADEPTGNLDRASTWVVVDLIKKINDWGTTIIFGTHDTEIVNTLKKRVIHIEKGKVIHDVQGGRYE